MNHAFFSRCKFYKCSEIFNTYNDTFKNLSLFKVGNNNIDKPYSFFNTGFICSAYRYIAFFININFDITSFNNSIDSLTALSYYFTNLGRVNLNLYNLWWIWANLSSRLCDTLSKNFIYDICSCFLCTCNSLFNDFSCKTMNSLSTSRELELLRRTKRMGIRKPLLRKK